MWMTKELPTSRGVIKPGSLIAYWLNPEKRIRLSRVIYSKGCKYASRTFSVEYVQFSLPADDYTYHLRRPGIFTTHQGHHYIHTEEYGSFCDARKEKGCAPDCEAREEVEDLILF